MIHPRILKLLYYLGLTNLAGHEVDEYSRFYFANSKNTFRINAFVLKLLFKCGLTNLSLEDVHAYISITSPNLILTREETTTTASIISDQIFNVRFFFRLLAKNFLHHTVNILNVAMLLLTICSAYVGYLNFHMLQTNFLVQVALGLTALSGLLNFATMLAVYIRERENEIAVRKIQGATTNEFVIQHLIETFLTTALSVAIAFIAIILVFQKNGSLWINYQLIFPSSKEFAAFLCMIGTGFVVVAGLSTVFVFMRLSPIEILKGKHYQIFGSHKQNVIVTLQLILAIVVTTCTLALLDSQDFNGPDKLSMANKEVLGYNYFEFIHNRSLISFANNSMKLIGATDGVRPNPKIDLAKIFCAITLLFSFIGLYNQVRSEVLKRAKEAAIRRILGGTLPGILVLFARYFLGVSLFALFASIPLTFFILKSWAGLSSPMESLRVYDIFGLISTLIAIVIGLVVLQVSRITRHPTKEIRYQ